MPAVISVGWDILRRSDDLSLLTQFHVRFLGSFTDHKVYFTFIILSVTFISSGVISLVYFLDTDPILLYTALYIQIGSMVAAAIAVVSIYIGARRVSTEEITRLIGFATAKPKSKNRPKITTPDNRGKSAMNRKKQG